MNQTLPVNEIFYSIQGEGLWAGTPMVFIRLSGCNLKCDFCDTDFELVKEMSIDQIIDMVNSISPADTRVCLTGGEPTIHYLEPLIEALTRTEHLVHLETNGTLTSLPFGVYWVTVSPKRLQDKWPYCHEVKFLCGPEGWEDLIFNTLPFMPTVEWIGLQPINLQWQQTALLWVLQNSQLEVRYSCQIHKTLPGVR